MTADQAADKNGQGPPEFKETPSRDWTFHGWEEFDTALKVKDPKGSKDDEPAEGEGTEGEGTEGAEGEAEPTEEELDLEKYRYRASEGSVPYNEDRENLLVLDQQSRVLAVLPIEELKESSKGVET